MTEQGWLTMRDCDPEKRIVNKAITQRGVKYAHLKIGEKSAATVAYAIVNGVMHYGVSFKAPTDLFCRAEGRLNSMRRLFDRKQLSGEIHLGG